MTNTFHPRPSGLASRCGKWSPVSGSTPWISTVEETLPGHGDLEHALQIEGMLELLNDERLDREADDPRDRSCLAVATTGADDARDPERSWR